eukprot:TRINITY_DN1091_c0_g1_i1.p1 TRINITY_DN1091_c0_g1~~TRINITY_DN1091_c0_g1_i1.p1  ORF type:complete len:315 (-),score=57.70 TRINITY_DN1091_c0_g1_i1:266-1129(-)
MTSPDCKAADWGKPSLFVTIFTDFSIRFVMTVLTISCVFPVGLYMPNLLIGMLFGRSVGEALKLASIGINPGAMALIGGAAYIGAITRTFSSSVVVIELTGQIGYLVEVTLATIVSILVYRLMSKSIFETIIENRGLPYLPDVQIEEIQVATIMERNPSFVSTTPTVAEVQSALENIATNQLEIAVVAVRPKGNQLLGKVSRELLHNQLGDVLMLASQAGRPPATWRVPLEFVQCMSLADTTPLSHVHLTLIKFHLQHVFVTTNGYLSGLISRACLKDATQRKRFLF